MNKHLERFKSKFLISASGCWDWTGKINKNNAKLKYGRFVFDGQRILAHRFSYMVYKGVVQNGLELDHLCRNTLCVNPSHLEAVSRKENVLRGHSPAANHARKTCCKNGHDFNIKNTWFYKDRRDCKLCHRAAMKRWSDKKNCITKNWIASVGSK